MMKKIMLFLVTCFSLAFALRPDMGTVMGKVKDKATGEVLSFTHLILEQDNQEKYRAETDLGGRYKIPEVAAGVYTVRLSREEYASKNIQGFVVKGHNINFMDIDLEKIKQLTEKEKKKLARKKRMK